MSDHDDHDDDDNDDGHDDLDNNDDTFFFSKFFVPLSIPMSTKMINIEYRHQR